MIGEIFCDKVRILDEKERTKAGDTISPKGLALAEVKYD